MCLSVPYIGVHFKQVLLYMYWVSTQEKLSYNKQAHLQGKIKSCMLIWYHSEVNPYEKQSATWNSFNRNNFKVIWNKHSHLCRRQAWWRHMFDNLTTKLLQTAVFKMVGFIGILDIVSFCTQHTPKVYNSVNIVSAAHIRL